MHCKTAPSGRKINRQYGSTTRKCAARDNADYVFPMYMLKNLWLPIHGGKFRSGPGEILIILMRLNRDADYRVVIYLRCRSSRHDKCTVSRIPIMRRYEILALTLNVSVRVSERPVDRSSTLVWWRGPAIEINVTVARKSKLAQRFPDAHLNSNKKNDPDYRRDAQYVRGTVYSPRRFNVAMIKRNTRRRALINFRINVTGYLIRSEIGGIIRAFPLPTEYPREIPSRRCGRANFHRRIART